MGIPRIAFYKKKKSYCYQTGGFLVGGNQIAHLIMKSDTFLGMQFSLAKFLLILVGNCFALFGGTS